MSVEQMRAAFESGQSLAMVAGGLHLDLVGAARCAVSWLVITYLVAGGLASAPETATTDLRVRRRTGTRPNGLLLGPPQDPQRPVEE